MKKVIVSGVFASSLLFASLGFAQEALPKDRGWVNYHKSPDWRDSEAHPLRIIAYVFHPIGWFAQEVLFRPFSYLMGANDKVAVVTGYKKPDDAVMKSCLQDDGIPSCGSVAPYNYRELEGARSSNSNQASTSGSQVYLPDVNFDFNRKDLNELGKGKVRQIAAVLKQTPGMNVVLEGNADARGEDTYNQKLGTDRAEAVRRELVAQGVDPSQLSSLTFGETKPALEGNDGPAWAVNRRVEAKLIEAPKN